LTKVAAALDPEMALDVMFSLTKSGMTIVMITHETQFAQVVADRIIFMDSGEIVGGDPESMIHGITTTNHTNNLGAFSFFRVCSCGSWLKCLLPSYFVDHHQIVEGKTPGLFLPTSY
jgi:energy-coupling factor transporter ATP-binding protein EcfA2